jgi:hypothetical protein
MLSSGGDKSLGDCYELQRSRSHAPHARLPPQNHQNHHPFRFIQLLLALAPLVTDNLSGKLMMDLNRRFEVSWMKEHLPMKVNSINLPLKLCSAKD